MVVRADVLAYLADNVSPERLNHILEVEKMCINLAVAHQLDEAKASCAGLMHDLAKFFPPNKLWQIAKEENIETDSILETHPHLLHADVSAVIARKLFGVEDEEILNAISNHTLGRPFMSDLSCIVFIADAIEPGRGNTPELEQIRQVSRENIYTCVRLCCDYSLKYLLNKTAIIHPRAILTRNWALKTSL